MAGTDRFFPAHCCMPSTTNVVSLQQSVEDLLHELQITYPGIKINMKTQHKKALNQQEDFSNQWQLMYNNDKYTTLRVKRMQQVQGW